MNTAIKPKLQRFAAATAFACPLCKEALSLTDSSLKCPQGHSFDLAKSGYVNLAPQVRQSKDYDRTSFLNRQRILEAGFYQHILDRILGILADQDQAQTILDAGCGEGYYARKIQESLPDKQLYAFDLSRDSIQLAAKSDHSWAINWFVGDLARLPIQSQSMDLILDIFSPANYQEFARVLTEQGLLIKVLPREEHLREIRQIVGEQLQHKDYSNQEILDHLKKSFDILASHDCRQTLPLQPADREALLSMTPLLFHVDRNQIDWSQLEQVTIAATIIVARPIQR